MVAVRNSSRTVNHNPITLDKMRSATVRLYDANVRVLFRFKGVNLFGWEGKEDCEEVCDEGSGCDQMSCSGYAGSPATCGGLDSQSKHACTCSVPAYNYRRYNGDRSPVIACDRAVAELPAALSALASWMDLGTSQNMAG